MPSPPSDLPPPARPWGLWATFGLSTVVLVVFLLLQTLAAVAVLTLQLMQNPESVEATAQNVEADGFLLAIATLVSAPICTALIVWFVRLRQQMPVNAYLALKRPRAEQLLKWLLISIVFIVTLDLLKSLINRPVVPVFMTEVYQTAAVLPLLYLAVVVMAPVFEEVFFRGFLFRGILYSPLGVWGAIGLPALIWSLIHLQYAWYDILGIFGFGLLLGVAQLRTGTLYIPIAMHAFNNLLALVQVAWRSQ